MRFRAVVEPPGRAQAQRRVVPGERCELAAVGGLIQREQDDRELRLVAEPIQQRLQRLHVLRRLRNIRADIAAELREQRRVVIAERARVNLHHQAIVETHPRHLCEHLGAEQLGVFSAGAVRWRTRLNSDSHSASERSAVSARRMTVIGGRRAAFAREELAARSMRLQITAPRVHVRSP